MNFLFLSKDFNQIDQVFMAKLLLINEGRKNSGVKCEAKLCQSFQFWGNFWGVGMTVGFPDSLFIYWAHSPKKVEDHLYLLNAQGLLSGLVVCPFPFAKDV